jgi:hypothetical protein
MEEGWFGDLRSRVPWLVGVAAALLVLAPVVNIVAVLIGGGDELSYDHGLGMTTCRIESAPCWTIVELEIGNTGSVLQEVVDIDLASFPDWSLMGQRVVNIVASGVQTQPPEVTVDVEHKRIRVERLEVNRMIDFELLIVGQAGRAKLADAKPVVRASGRVIESNPKATALVRAFRTAFAFLI